jgi:effector-binding domain-containing protein
MLDEPQIVKTADQGIAVIRLTVPRGEIQKVMGPGHRELMAAVAAQGVATTGPWFTHHLRLDPAVFDFEIGVPVAAPVAAAGRVRGGERPALTLARAILRGPYEGLAAAWGELDAWLAAHGHVPAPDLWERYALGPESSADPADWRTELDRPLAG